HEGGGPGRAVGLDRHAVDRLGIATAPRSPIDGSLDAVLWHGVVACLLDRGREREVRLGVPPALTSRDGDRARELREELPASCIRRRLLVLDGRPLGVTGHGSHTRNQAVGHARGGGWAAGPRARPPAASASSCALDTEPLATKP